MGILTKVRWLPGQEVPSFVYRPVPPHKFQWKGKNGYGSMQVLTLVQRKILNKLFSNGEIWFVGDGEQHDKSLGPIRVEESD